MSLELDMEPTQTFDGEKVSEGIGYAFPVTGMIDFLCEIVEQAEDAPYKSQLEGMVGVLVKASYSMLAGQSSELKKRLENPEWKERWKAAYALGDWGDETASTALCTLLAKEDDPLVRSAAEIALRKLQTRLEARPGSS